MIINFKFNVRNYVAIHCGEYFDRCCMVCVTSQANNSYRLPDSIW